MSDTPSPSSPPQPPPPSSSSSGPWGCLPQGWWQRASSAAADSGRGFGSVPPASGSGCSYRTVVSTQCRLETDEHGVPQRRCERIVRKMRECPGRPAEVVERMEESSTEQNYREPSAKDLDLLPRREAEGEAILRSDVGELFEDFFKVAAEVEQNYFNEVPSAGTARPERSEDSKENAAADSEDTFMRRLFRRRPREPKGDVPVHGKGTKSAPQYKDYSQDFQEV